MTTGKCVLVGVGDRSCCTERREMDRSSLVSLEREDGRTDRGRRKTGEKTDAAGLCEKNARSFYVIFFSLCLRYPLYAPLFFFLLTPLSPAFFSVPAFFSCSLFFLLHVEIPSPPSRIFPSVSAFFPLREPVPLFFSSLCKLLSSPEDPSGHPPFLPLIFLLYLRPLSCVFFAFVPPPLFSTYTAIYSSADQNRVR